MHYLYTASRKGEKHFLGILRSLTSQGRQRANLTYLHIYKNLWYVLTLVKIACFYHQMHTNEGCDGDMCVIN